MQGNLVGVTIRGLVIDPQGCLYPVPDGLSQYVLCRPCGEYFERGFGELTARAMMHQADTAANGAAS